MQSLRHTVRALAATIAISAISTVSNADDIVRISGTGSATGGMQRVAEAFATRESRALVEISAALGSTGGISALLVGKLDIALSNRLPNEKELARAALVATEYARTPFVVAVHKDLGVHGLSAAQLAAIYGEGAVNFPNGKRARPILRLAEATDTALLKSFSPLVAAALDAASARRGMLHATTDTETADLIEKTPGGFAVSTLALIESERRPLIALAIDGVAPSIENLANGTYPYFKRLYLITAVAPTPATRRFLAFLQSEDGRRILAAHGHLVR